MGPKQSENGQILALLALCLPLIIGFAGFATDIGVLLVEKQRQQAATDSAAVAGAAELHYGDWTTVAQSTASLNGYANGSNGVTVSVNPSGTSIPSPLYGNYAGQSGYLEVIVTENVPTYFMRLFNIASVPVQTRAVAGLGTSTNCIYILGSSGTTVTVNNDGQLYAPGCGIMVNSSGTPAMAISGSANVTGAWVDVVGTATADNSGSKYTPAATTGVAPVSDPLAYLTPPSYTPSSCMPDPISHYQGGAKYSVGPGSAYSTTENGNTVCYTSLSLGVNGDSVTVNPGIYVITGSLSTGSATVSGGDGVTFYLVGNGSVNIQNGSTISFTAPTSGAYNGILFYQDRSDTAAATVEGGASSSLKGILYFPSASLQIGNGTATTAYTPIVSKSLTLVGGSNLTDDDYASINSSDPLQSPRLVE